MRVPTGITPYKEHLARAGRIVHSARGGDRLDCGHPRLKGHRSGLADLPLDVDHLPRTLIDPDRGLRVPQFLGIELVEIFLELPRRLSLDPNIADHRHRNIAVGPDSHILIELGAEIKTDVELISRLNPVGSELIVCRGKFAAGLDRRSGNALDISALLVLRRTSNPQLCAAQKSYDR